MTKAPEFRGNSYRKAAELNAWTKQRQEAALEPGLPIIDSHHHVWDDNRGRYLIDDLAEDTDTGHNIIATVFVECGSKYRTGGAIDMQPLGEIEFINEIVAIRQHAPEPQFCAGIVGHANLMLGSEVRPVLEALVTAGRGRIGGIRHGVVWDQGDVAKFARYQVPRYLLLDPKFRLGFAQLELLGLSFDAWLYYPQLPDLMDLLAAFPDTTVILNHVGGLLGVPPHDNRGEVFRTWRGYIGELARFPNLTIKLGGLGALHCGWDFYVHDVPPSSEQLASVWRPYIEVCIEAFGPDRCMLESNFPPDKQSCSYGVLWNAFKRISQGYSAVEKSALYRDTAARVYRLTL